MRLARMVRPWFRRAGFDIVRTRPSVTRVSSGEEIPDLEFYTPLFSPWNGLGEFERYFQMAAPFTLVSRDRCWTLYRTALQCTRLGGEYWECGVYKGGTARLLASLLSDANRTPKLTLRLFDTFGG